MKFKKIYTLGLGLLIAGMSAVNAQTQDDEKIFYRMDRVKANNPWTKSLNYAGLTFNENQDFTIVDLISIRERQFQKCKCPPRVQ